MTPIKSISPKDIGRVAASIRNGSQEYGYHIRVLELASVTEHGQVRVRAQDMNSGAELPLFAIIGGGSPLYWVEDPAKDLDYPEITLDVSTAVHASQHVNQTRGVMDVMAYLTAETGECADWLVNPDRQKEDLLGECADVIICALDLALVYKKKTSDLDGQELADEVIGQLNELLKLKAEKWMDKHAKL
jgi:NTP pyrophosphatase (non-canonical NTP hydrolase)|nr:MAG TPA: hypothetical protein [Caudoviricetes sp.]